jgi:oligopeptide transport system ATP-binding protein
MTQNEPLLSVKNLVHEFRTSGGVIHAVSGVSFDVHPGETLGIVGETGSGKSTLARCVLQAPRPASGEVIFRGTDLTTLRGTRLLQARRHVQLVFQDPFGSLDPKWAVRALVEEPLIAYGAGGKNERRERVDEALELVGLDPASHGRRRPRELSGGQAQRVAIARAIALNPALLICDEPVSSLDVLIQAQVLNLFERLRTELSLSYLFIATTWPWSSWSATGWRSCTWASCARSGRGRWCTGSRCTPTPGPCSTRCQVPSRERKGPPGSPR